jgi:vacuolar-type H+-ATPase subunit F/Vma7
MLKLIIIGKRADILPFRAVGAELVEINDDSKAGSAIESLKNSEVSLMVMMTEDLAELCQKEITEFRLKKTNMFLSIPSIKTTPGARLDEIRKLVTRALGVDLIGQSIEHD